MSDDERDYAEERAQEDATREEQEEETLGDPVDSSSPDFEDPFRAQIKALGAPEERPQKRSMLWEDGTNALVLVDQLDAIFQLLNRAYEQTTFMRAIHKEGVGEEIGTIQLSVSPMEAQALSVGLNLVGFFAPDLAEDAKGLLARASELTDAFVPSEEQKASIFEAAERMMRKATEAMIAKDDGFLLAESLGGDPRLN